MYRMEIFKNINRIFINMGQTADKHIYNTSVFHKRDYVKDAQKS